MCTEVTGYCKYVLHNKIIDIACFYISFLTAVEVDSGKAHTLHLLHVDSCGEEDVCFLEVRNIYFQKALFQYSSRSS